MTVEVNVIGEGKGRLGRRGGLSFLGPLPGSGDILDLGEKEVKDGGRHQGDTGPLQA